MTRESIDHTRRRVLFMMPAAVLLVPVVGAAVACSKSQPPVDCSDLSALSPDQMQLRAQVGYQRRGPAGLACNGCFHWLAEATPDCGKCRVMPGPVDAAGYCKLFVATG